MPQSGVLRCRYVPVYYHCGSNVRVLSNGNDVLLHSVSPNESSPILSRSIWMFMGVGWSEQYEFSSQVAAAHQAVRP